MARIPRYHQQQLSRLEIPNPGVDTSALQVGNSLLKNTSELASDINHSQAVEQSVVSNVIGAAITGLVTKIHHDAYQKAYSAQMAVHTSDINAKAAATIAQRSTYDLLDKTRKWGEQNPNGDMQGYYEEQHKTLTGDKSPLVLQRFYDHETGKKVVDPVGLNRFQSYMQTDLTQKHEIVGGMEITRDRQVAESNYNGAKFAALQSVQGSDGSPALLKDAIAPFISQNGKEPFMKSAANSVLGIGKSDEDLQKQVQATVKASATAAMTVDETALTKKLGSKSAALKAGFNQLTAARDWFANSPEYKDNLTSDEKKSFTDSVDKAQKANLTAQGNENNAKLVTSMFDDSALAWNGVASASQGDTVGAQKILTQLNTDISNLSQTSDKSPKALQRLNALKGHAGAIINMSEQYQRFQAVGAQKDFLAQQAKAFDEGGDTRIAAQTALDELPHASDIDGSPQNYIALNAATIAISKAAQSGAYGFGKAAQSKIAAQFGRLNAARAMMDAKKDDKTVDFGQQLWEGAASFAGQLKPAPKEVMQSVNPGNLKSLHNLANTNWQDYVASTTAKWKADPLNKSTLDAHGGNVPADVIAGFSTPKFKQDFVTAFKADHPYGAVDAQGNPLNGAIMPPAPTGVAAVKAPSQVNVSLKFGKDSGRQPTAKLVPPPNAAPPIAGPSGPGEPKPGSYYTEEPDIADSGGEETE